MGSGGSEQDAYIGKDAVVNAQSGVKGDLPGGKAYFGSPAEEARDKMKEFVWIRRIPELWDKVMGHGK